LVRGALTALGLDANWEEFGAVSVEVAAQAARGFIESMDICNPHVGLIAAFPTRGAPSADWVLCDGATYLRSQFPLLAEVIDVSFLDPDGIHMRVPDLRGVTVIGAGQGAGLTNRTLGDKVGTETHALTGGQMPSHTHGMTHNHAYSQTTYLPGLAFFPGELPVVVPPAVPVPAVTGPSSALVTGNAGSGFAHPNMQPSYALQYCIKVR